LDLLLEPVALGTASDLHEGGQPVQRREHLGIKRAWLDDPRPTDDRGGPVTAFVSFALLALEWRHAAVRIRDRLGTIVGGEDDNRVVELADVFQLLEDDTDVVVHLLHTSFVDTPVLAALLTDHGVVLR